MTVSDSPSEVTSGDIFVLMGECVTIRVAGSDAGGRLCVAEHLGVRGVQTAWHVQHDDDEVWHILDGELTYWIGDPSTPARRVGPGDAVVAPRGTPHAYRIESSSASFLSIHTPALHEQFYAMVGDRVAQAVVPHLAAPDLARLGPACERAGITVVGPPPGDAHRA